MIMLKNNYLLFVFVIFSFLCISCSKQEPSTENHTIPYSDTAEDRSFVAELPADTTLAAGDTLMVSVWNQEALTKEVTLDATGNIYYPFIGKIKASGLTIEQLQAEMEQQLSYYYNDPKLTVAPKNLAGQQYYVLGEVSKPGKFIIKAHTTVLEAVSSAGGPNKDAGKTILLLHKQKDSLLITSMPLQYSNMKESHLSAVTMQVRADDILYLAPSKIANLEKFMIRLNNILNPLLALERGILYWPELVKAIDGSSNQQILLPIQ